MECYYHWCRKPLDGVGSWAVVLSDVNMAKGSPYRPLVYALLCRDCTARRAAEKGLHDPVDVPCPGGCGMVMREYGIKGRPCSPACAQRVRRRERRPDKTRTCAHCGTTFTPVRLDAKTCSGRCRIALMRQQQRVATSA